MNVAPTSGLRCHTTARRSGSTKGSGRSSTASTTLKTAVLAPIASASTSVATTKRSGSRRADLSAYRRSWTMMLTSLLIARRGRSTGATATGSYLTAGVRFSVSGKDSGGRNAGSRSGTPSCP